MAMSNYDITRDRVRGVFLQYDQQKMIDKFALKSDNKYIYVMMLRREYRIGRGTGMIEWSDDGFRTSCEADFNASLTICDVLCDSKDDCKLAGRFASLQNLKGMVRVAGPGGELFQPYADRFCGHVEALREACCRLGTPVALPGDVAVRLDAFPFLPVVLQFWDADEDFPAALKFLFDENILDFMRYETTFYLTSHILARLTQAPT